jgi:hypothetical protein
MNDSNAEGRTVRCTIEMDLIEGEHFNAVGYRYIDEDVATVAKRSFIDTIHGMLVEDELTEYVQCKVIE